MEKSTGSPVGMKRANILIPSIWRWKWFWITRTNWYYYSSVWAWWLDTQIKCSYTQRGGKPVGVQGNWLCGR